MKLFSILLLSALLYTASDKPIFTEDVLVKDFNGKVVNLKEIEITKDSVLLFIWSKFCSNCISSLDNYKSWNLIKNYQVIAIELAKGDTIAYEKKLLEEHQWPFEIYYDNYYNQNLTRYLVKKGYCKKPKNAKNEVEGFTRFPHMFLFVKGKLICNEEKDCNPYLYP